jgi:hypothetical protein
MTPAIVHYIALAVRVAGGIAVVALLIVAAIFLQRARSGAYYVVREEARTRGLRLLIIAIAVIPVALGLGAGVDSFARPASVARVTATPAPTAIPTQPEPTVTFTSEPPTNTPTPRPTATPLPVPTATPSPTRIPPTDLPPTLLTPVPSAVPAADNASFGPIQLGSGWVNFQLTGTGAVFPLDVPIVHATFLVRNLNRNAAWTAAWYHEGKYVAGDPLLWDASPNTVGHVYYGPRGGYKAGKWELRLYIEDRLQQKVSFIILNATSTPTATPPPTETAAPPTQ